MKCNKSFRLPILLLLVLLCGAGCRRIGDTFGFTGKVLAEVGDEKLYLSEVLSTYSFGPAVSAEDSVKLLEAYVDMWVRKQVKLQEAERRFSKNIPEIERMVEDYHNSLLSMRLDSYFVDAKLDTVVTREQMEDYYQANRSDFTLDRTIVRGRLVRVPDDFRQKARLKDLFGWDTEAQKQDFIGMCQKNDLEFVDFPSWTDYSDFIAHLPGGLRDREEAIRSKGGVQDIRDRDVWYYFVITSSRGKGEPVPVERAQTAIVRNILNGRRAEIIRSCEDSIYNVAIKEKLVKNNVK